MELKHCFRHVCGNLNPKKNAERILNSVECPKFKIAQNFLKFFSEGKRGFAKYKNKDRNSGG